MALSSALLLQLVVCAASVASNSHILSLKLAMYNNNKIEFYTAQ